MRSGGLWGLATSMEATASSPVLEESGTAYLFPDPPWNQHNACAETGWLSPILASEEFCHRLPGEDRSTMKDILAMANNLAGVIANRRSQQPAGYSFDGVGTSSILRSFPEQRRDHRRRNRQITSFRQ